MSEFSANLWVLNEGNERNKSLAATAESAISRRQGCAGRCHKGIERSKRGKMGREGTSGGINSATRRTGNQAVGSEATARTGVLCSSGNGGSHHQVSPPKSGAGGDRGCSSTDGLPDEAGDPSASSGQAVERGSEDVGQDGGLGTIGLAVPVRTFHSTSSLVGVAGLGVALPPHTQFPGGSVDFRVTSQADVAVGEERFTVITHPKGYSGSR